MSAPMDPKTEKMVREAVQEMVDRQVARLGALSRTLTSTDRIITGRRDLAVKFGSQGAPFQGKYRKTPAYTDGKLIAINDGMLPDIRTKQGLVTTLGLNYHELAHNLFTPGHGSRLVIKIKYQGLYDTFNLLEDARIETLLVAKYRSAAKFLSAPVLEFIIKDEKTWATAHLFVHGRRFIPKEVRRELRNFFQGDAKMRAECESVIDEYRKLDLSYERYHDRAFELIEKLDQIMKGPLAQCLSQEEQDAMNQHGACGGIGSPSGGFNNGLMDIRKETKDASRRRDEEDAAQEEEKEAQEEGGEDVEDVNDEPGEDPGEDEEDTEDEYGTEEQPDGDAGDVDDDSENDGDDTEKESEADEDEDGDGGYDSEEDIDEEDDEDGLSGDEPEGDDEGDEGGSPGGPSSGSNGDVGDDGDASGDDPDSLTDAEGEDGSGSVAGVGEGDIDALAEALAGAVEDLEGDSEVDDEVSRLQEAMEDDSLFDSIMPEIPYSDLPVDADAAQAASAVMREFQKLNTRFEAGWDYGTDYGRLNTQRAMSAEWGDMDIFDHWEEGREMDAAIEAFFAVDRSSSMGTAFSAWDLMTPACKALWVIKRALDDVDGLSTVCTFDSGNAQKLYGRGEKADPSIIRRVNASGGTNPTQAINEGRRVLTTSDRPNKLFGIITDGDWAGNIDTIKNLLSSIRGTRVFIGIQQQCPDHFRDAFDVVATINKPEDIAEVIRKCVVSMLDEALKRR